ncbi:hypothetical protein CDL12_01710 [Handroanthus impetiginosus]|uniref:Uncharacterized protein n=1 Tax=Handroanthus impetiginosus TaxID=429701 RepID=A0A2G9I734_9LAMI|nr:hypothetical protein CDL12_01710 [Handroanthus impetiginosus]
MSSQDLYRCAYNKKKINFIFPNFAPNLSLLFFPPNSLPNTSFCPLNLLRSTADYHVNFSPPTSSVDRLSLLSISLRQPQSTTDYHRQFLSSYLFHRPPIS